MMNRNNKKIDHSKMIRAGQLVRETFKIVERFVRPGITTERLDRAAFNHISSNGGIPAPLGYTVNNSPPFPKSICTSVNNVAGHGIPRRTERLKDGDIISIDISLSVDGHFADACRTYMIGDVDDDTRDLVESTKAIHKLLISMAEVNYEDLWSGDIGLETEALCEQFGLYAVPGLGGHGIGRELHLEPFIPPDASRGRGTKIEIGTYFTIEPILSTRPGHLKMAPDGWTMYCPRGRLFAQEEHTLYLGPDGIEVLT